MDTIEITATVEVLPSRWGRLKQALHAGVTTYKMASPHHLAKIKQLYEKKSETHERRHRTLVQAISELPDSKRFFLHKYFVSSHEYQRDAVEEFVDTIGMLPQEAAVYAAVAACRENAGLVHTPAMKKWATTNASHCVALMDK